MTILKEGVLVSYIGEPNDGLNVGDRGKVLSAESGASHVLWNTGAATGTVAIIYNDDLAQDTPVHEFQRGPVVHANIRSVFERTGSVGLLNTLVSEGHMSTLTDVAADALNLVVSRLYEDPSMKEVLAQLDPEDGGEFIQLAASVLLRDSFS